MAAPVELTALARAGGCAAKYSAARLEELVGGLVTADAESSKRAIMSQR